MSRLIFVLFCGSLVCLSDALANDVGNGSGCLQHRQREMSSRITIGRLIPECDSKGDYKPLQCHPPSTNGKRFCQCWEKDGQIVTSPSRNTKACECPVARAKVTKKRLIGGFAPQCNTDGTFAKKQCHSGTGHCWCVNQNGEQKGERTRNHSSLSC